MLLLQIHFENLSSDLFFQQCASSDKTLQSRSSAWKESWQLPINSDGWIYVQKNYWAIALQNRWTNSSEAAFQMKFVMDLVDKYTILSPKSAHVAT